LPNSPFLRYSNRNALITVHLTTRSIFRCVVLFCLSAGSGCSSKTTAYSGTGAVKPEEAVATIDVEPGFQIELVAAEPLIADPVDMEIDEYGRLYVVEMHGYPLDKSGSGKIKLLTDTDADGKLDKSTIFATGLVLPNGVMRWKKGILVTDAPNVLYFEDTDGDGKADKKDTMLTGFSLSNPHINVNNPIYGLDNFIHLAHLGAITTRNYENIFGDKGTEVYYPGQPNGPKLPKNADNHCVRFRPDKHLLETTSGRAQFGHTFDRWGHYYYGDNQNHASAVVIDAAYVSRNPELPVPSAIEAISDHGAASEIFQITTNPERQLLSGVGTMTSASGISAYTGGLFPAPFDNEVTFICESVSNLVHADKQRDSGATVAAGRIGRPQHEFLASRDAWFRPVNTYIGPDGALYVVDYYRQIIEHPEWMSEEAVKAGGLYNGKDMGRIFRITPTGTKAADWIKGLKLGDATSKELVNYLDNKNGWWRLNAQRLLMDRGDKSIVPNLEALVKNASLPEGRLHALWSLEGLDALTPEVLKQALQDGAAGIRENAVKLAELHLKTTPELETVLLPLQKDENAKVRFQLLCTLGALSSQQAADARNDLLFQDINDKWVQIAALSASSSPSATLLPLVLKGYKAGVPAYGSLVQRLTTMVGAGSDKAAIHRLIDQATFSKGHAPWQGPVLDGLAKGLRNNKQKSMLADEEQHLVQTFFNHPSDEVRSGALNLLKVGGIRNEALAKAAVEKAAVLAADKSQSNDKRADAINFLALREPAAHATLLKSVIVPQEHPSVQLAALQVLSLVPDLTVNNYVLQAWPAMTPGIREAAIGTFLSNPQRINLLLDAVQSNKIPRTSLGWSRTSWLLGQDNDTIRTRARALLVNKDQEKINKGFEKALSLTGNHGKGRTVFQQNCGLCHQVRGEMGIKYGPDLGTVQNWLAKDIMANILAPNASIAVGYDLWEAKLKSGEAVQGIIATETAAAITLRTAPGQEKLINRQEIESLTVMNASPMPVLTSQLDHKQMADLLTFLRQTK
jgi:putative membrane-bound dehydrogenase-like protein